MIQDDNLVSKQRKRLLKAPNTPISTKNGEDFHKSIKAESLDVAFQVRKVFKLSDKMNVNQMVKQPPGTACPNGLKVLGDR